MSQTDQDLDLGVTPAAAPAADTGVTPADAPTAETGEKSITDIVLGALPGAEEESPTSEEPGSKDAKAADETPGETDKDAKPAAEDPDKLTAEDRTAKEKTQARIQELLDDRKGLNEQVASLTKERDALKPEADGYRTIQAFMRDNGLSAQETGNAIRIAALMKSDPRAALEALKPMMADLAKTSGDTLDGDLSEDVRLGRITQQRAAEIQRGRADAKLHQQREQRRTEEQQERDRQAEADRLQKQVDGFKSLGNSLAAQRAQTDPDWKQKEPLVADKLKAEIATKGLPKDDDELRERFNRAVTEVTTYLSGIVPKPKPTAASPSSASSSTGSAKPAPTSAHDAAMQAMENF